MWESGRVTFGENTKAACRQFGAIHILDMYFALKKQDRFC